MKQWHLPACAARPRADAAETDHHVLHCCWERLLLDLQKIRMKAIKVISDFIIMKGCSGPCHVLVKR